MAPFHALEHTEEWFMAYRMLENARERPSLGMHVFQECVGELFDRALAEDRVPTRASYPPGSYL